MIQTCECGKEFLTEADPYVIIPIKDYKTNCGCYFKDNSWAKPNIDYAHMINSKIDENKRLQEVNQDLRLENEINKYKRDQAEAALCDIDQILQTSTWTNGMRYIYKVVKNCLEDVSLPPSNKEEK